MPELSTAHRLSADTAIDPAYSADREMPPSSELPDAPFWQYGPAEYPCFRLSCARAAIVEAKLKVGYPGEFHEPLSEAWFECHVSSGALRFRACGSVEAFQDGTPIYQADASERPHAIVATHDGLLQLHLKVNDIATDLPALLFERSDIDEIRYSTDGKVFVPAEARASRVDEIPPHRADLPQISLTPQKIADGYFDTERELLCVIEIEAKDRPLLYVGESRLEAENENPEYFEQNLDLVKIAPRRWQSACPLACRYIRIKNAKNPKVTCRVITTPVAYRGAFAVEDRELTRIWMVSAYTLRLCTHHFLVDGIKRDRLPWVGDLALSLIANAYVFGNPEPVRDTLTALGRAGIRKKHLNGIVDYSLWFLICHDLYQLYYGDADFLAREYARLQDLVDVLLAQADVFISEKDTWLFIDWVKGGKTTALQILFAWALDAAARLAKRMNDTEGAERYSSHAGKVREKLRAEAFDANSGLFYAAPGKPESGFSRHPNFLAILSGLLPSEQYAPVIQALCKNDLPPVGTPYQAALEILALHRGGAREEGLARIRKLWGGMLKMGATSFFEAYDESLSEEERYAFYGRPYGMSLCHAWSAGPAALLPILIFGCEPTSDRWESYRVNPLSGLSPNDTVTVPTPHGAIQLEGSLSDLLVTAPQQCIRQPETNRTHFN